MDAVTYPNDQVVKFMNENLAPVRVPITSKPLPKEFNATWTPTFIILDPQGQEHHRSVGYLPPEEFVPMLILGIAKSYSERGLHDEAQSRFEQIIKEYAQSGAAPEAVYYRGVSRFQETHDNKELRRIYDTLNDRYKGTDWAKRASVYQRL